eukprot:7160293-Pyramimonas_sp.AAC.1
MMRPSCRIPLLVPFTPVCLLVPIPQPCPPRAEGRSRRRSRKDVTTLRVLEQGNARGQRRVMARTMRA